MPLAFEMMNHRPSRFSTLFACVPLALLLVAVLSCTDGAEFDLGSLSIVNGDSIGFAALGDSAVLQVGAIDARGITIPGE